MTQRCPPDDFCTHGFGECNCPTLRDGLHERLAKHSRDRDSDERRLLFDDA
jgi:hypothetical protein